MFLGWRTRLTTFGPLQSNPVHSGSRFIVSNSTTLITCPPSQSNWDWFCVHLNAVHRNDYRRDTEERSQGTTACPVDHSMAPMWLFVGKDKSDVNSRRLFEKVSHGSLVICPGDPFSRTLLRTEHGCNRFVRNWYWGKIAAWEFFWLLHFTGLGSLLSVVFRSWQPPVCGVPVLAASFLWCSVSFVASLPSVMFREGCFFLRKLFPLVSCCFQKVVILYIKNRIFTPAIVVTFCRIAWHAL